MAITGTGTQADPYVVTTWDELADKAAESGKYVKLGNDIDLNNEYPDGIPSSKKLTFNAKQLDGDGKSIRNIAVSNDDISIFNFVERNKEIKNVNFENFRLAGRSAGFVYQNDYRGVDDFINCKFSGRLDTTDSNNPTRFDQYGYVRFQKCSFNLLMGTNTYMRAASSSYMFMWDCNIKFSGNVANGLNMILKNSYVTGSVPNATIVCDTQNSSQRGEYSVLDVVAAAATGDSGTNIVLANSDKITSINQYLEAVTTAQLTNAEYLESIGFPIQT